MKHALPALCLSVLLLATSSARAGDDTPTREAIERDLVLEATLASARTIQPGEPVRVSARIVNRSKTTTYKLVRPGDGSESGWRDPHVYFTADTSDARGVRTPVAEAGLGRCGLYDANWHDEVITLAPGKVLDLTNWMPMAHHQLRFEDEGTVSMRLHYRYTRGALGKGRKTLDPKAEGGTGPMGTTPAFELVSAAVRFHVIRLAEVRLVAKGPVTIGRSTLLSSVMDLEIENRATDPMLVSGAEVQIQVVRPGGVPPFFSEHRRIAPTVETKMPALGGGDTRSWSGPTLWQTLPDWRLTASRTGTFQVVATWRPTGRQAVYQSKPVEVTVRAP